VVGILLLLYGCVHFVNH